MPCPVSQQFAQDISILVDTYVYVVCIVLVYSYVHVVYVHILDVS